MTASPHGRRITPGRTWSGWLAKIVPLPERRVAVAVLSIGGDEGAVSERGTDLAEEVARRRTAAVRVRSGAGGDQSS